MGIAVIGGVISSTVLTLLVVPVVFLGMEWVRGGAGRLWARLNPPRVIHQPPEQGSSVAK